MRVSWKHESNWTSSTAKPKFNTRKCFKNRIIKTLAENHTFDNSNAKSTLSEELKVTNSKFQQKRSRRRKHKKVDWNWSNCFETLHITDSNTESENEASDDITTTDSSTENNARPGYTHRIHQLNDNLKEVNKIKNKITKNVNRVMICE